MTTLNPVEHIIWSADVDGEQALLDRLLGMPELKIVKVDRNFVTDIGLDVIRRLTEDHGLKVFDDAKIIEIPTKMAEIAKKHLARKPFMLNCMAHGVSNGNFGDWVPGTKDERDGLKRFADLCRESGTMPVAVTVLTSKTDEICQQEFAQRAKEQVGAYCSFLVDAGFQGVVCSAKEVEMVRGFPDLEPIVPATRLPGGDAGDQARVDTPGNAFAAGARYTVHGRELTDDTTGENFQRIVDNICAALAA